jgi:hypothetical protein
VVALWRTVTSTGLPPANYSKLKTALITAKLIKAEDDRQDLIDTLLYVPTQDVPVAVRKAALIALGRLCTGDSKTVGDLVGRLGIPSAVPQLHTGLVNVNTPVLSQGLRPVGVLADREAASALLDLGALLGARHARATAICTAMCERVLEVVKIHRGDEDLTRRACIVLDVFTHKYTTGDAKVTIIPSHHHAYTL